MNKTRVSGHPKERQTGRFNWKTHEREIERLQQDKRSGKTHISHKELDRRYKKRGYKEPKPLTTAKHGSKKEYVKPNPDGTQDHARVWDKENKIKVEEHTDLRDPNIDPAGHVILDVGVVGLAREVEHENENRTKSVTFKKRG